MRYSIFNFFRKESNGESFTNLEFHVMDAGNLSPNWTGEFDLALIFDACHDQMRPDLVIGRAKILNPVPF